MQILRHISSIQRTFILAILLTITCFRPLITYAATSDCSEQKLRDLGVTVLNCGGVGSVATCADTGLGAPAATTNGSNVYILGDSITAKAETKYKSAFSQKSMNADVDGSSSRSITGAGIDGNKLTGLAAVDADKDLVAKAGIIIIALGTNGGNTADSISQLITKIHSYNTTGAPIYWVDTTVISRASYVPVIRDANRAIDAGSDNGKNYKVIPWFTAVTPGGDHLNPTGTETDVGKLINTTDGLNVHPTSAGVDALVGLVVNTVSGGAPVVATDGTACTSPASTIPGGDNTAEAYNYFIRKGLQSFQAAAIVGNMIAESGVNPKRVEGTYFGKNSTCNRKTLGYPREMDTPPIDNVFGPNSDCVGQPTGNVQPGYGLVQWSGGRRGVVVGGNRASAGGLIAFAAADSQKRIESNVLLQLDFVWQELQTGYKKSVYEPLAASTTIETAVDVWVRHYEIPCVGDACIPTVADRTVFANSVLAKAPTK